MVLSGVTIGLTIVFFKLLRRVEYQDLKNVEPPLPVIIDNVMPDPPMELVNVWILIFVLFILTTYSPFECIF